MSRNDPELFRRLKSSLLITTLLVASPLLQAAPEKEADPALARAVEKAEVVCKRVRETGSRTTTRVCTTKQKREDRAERAREDLERLAERRSGQPTGEF